jgi:hypothetical protein
MELAGSTLIGPAGGGKARLRRMAVRILGGGRGPSEAVALLLPLVRRAVRTQRGPAALVSWLRQRPGPPAGAAALAEALARLLCEPPGPPTHSTVRDDRRRPDPTPDAP